MKKLRANSSPSSPRLRQAVFVVVGIAIVLTLLQSIGFLRPLQIIADQVFLPVRRAVTGTTALVARQVGTLASLGSLASENSRLDNEVKDLKKQLANMREVNRENDLLRAQLGFNSRQSLQLVPARVAGYNPDNIRRSLTIDIGRSAGITKGMAVVSNGALVGSIDEVNDFSAKVFLLSDVDFRIRAIGQDNRANGIVAGQIGSGYSMDKIAQGDKISRGETVITAGSGAVPKGLIIGTVESVESSDDAVFQLASIRPAINLAKLELVFVVRGQK
jgi:rod shape-determining protein MreC